MSTAAIVSVRQDETDHHFIVRDADPAQLALDLRAAITAMASPARLDMGDLACALAQTLRVDYGANAVTMLPGGHPARFYVEPDVRWHFTIAKPERSLRIEARRVLIEDKRRVAISFFDGAWSDFERQIKAITRNLLRAEPKR